MTKEIGNIEIWSDEFDRKDGSIDMWFSIKTLKYGHKCTIVRSFKVQKVLNNNYHLN